jgi:hypothetical protein
VPSQGDSACRPEFLSEFLAILRQRGGREEEEGGGRFPPKFGNKKTSSVDKMIIGDYRERLGDILCPCT